PQAHDIIRTWLFSTVLRSHLEEGVLPWANTAISGWVLDPDRKKMSKSKGNVVTPLALLEEHGSDAVRYWAAKGGPGVDTAFDSSQMKVGRRLAIKLLNASKFVLSKRDPAGPISEPLDRGMVRRLARLVTQATAALESYDYAAALRETEEFFWWFCDDYIELVKRRRAGDGHAAASAAAAGTAALSVLLRLLAPFLPFVTEEVWSWWQTGSVHRAPWPDAALLTDGADATQAEPDEAAVVAASTVTSRIRQERSQQKLGFGVPVRATLVLPASHRGAWQVIEGDVLAGNNVSGADVSFDAERFDLSIQPLAPNA
ncbi:MAG: class I tRNA ligase family protein, partial [Vicinamibacterales bacterium]